jgi:dephospho-CoA kinase
MIVLGLTGSIGMGKSTAARLLRRLNVPVHESDAAVHRLLAAGGKAVGPVLALFPDVADGAGGIDRPKLGGIVFATEAQRKKLEAILHPLVIQSQRHFLQRQRQQGRKIAALDIPLLYETGGENRVDHVIVVTAPYFLQRQRVLKRGLSEAAFFARLKTQLPDAQKRRRADFVVQTGAGLAYTLRALKIILHSLVKEGPSP